MSDEDRQMYVFANNPEGHQLLHTFKQLLRNKGEDEGLIAIVKGVQSHDQQIALTAEIVTFKDILEAYRQTTGIDTNLFTDYLIEKIGKLSGNPFEGLITNDESGPITYTKEELDSMLKDARKRAYSRGFQTAKTVSAKRIATLKQAQENQDV